MAIPGHHLSFPVLWLQIWPKYKLPMFPYFAWPEKADMSNPPEGYHGLSFF